MFEGYIQVYRGPCGFSVPDCCEGWIAMCYDIRLALDLIGITGAWVSFPSTG